ncbi:hypothetical protein [Nocardia sp. NPDC057668]|uniref:hypothetical protein n=1 Tax=Nocardia sp. NPDC057668 TaxID=3346202 RepID=UPI00366CF407
MDSNIRIRRAHRWLGIAFAATILIVFLGLALSGPDWLYYLPLFPLALSFLTGAYLYVRWYTGARRTPAVAAAGSASRVRPVHRWSAVIFTLSVLATSVALSLPEPIEWVSYIPLFPLLALLVTGLSMALRTRRARPASARG